MAIVLGFVAALVGAAAALIGTWLSTRQAARLERENGSGVTRTVLATLVLLRSVN